MKNSTKISILLLLVAIAIWFYAKRNKASQKTPKKVLETAIENQVNTMDPAYAKDDYSQNEVAKVYEGLLEYHYLKRPYELVPNLAAAMPTVSDDQLVYTFQVQQGIKFHDDSCFPEGKGRELTAQDFVYTFQRLADPKVQSTGFWLIDGKLKGLNEWRQKYEGASNVDYTEEIAGLRALDKYTLQFTLTQPWPQFLNALANPHLFVVPQEAVQHYGPEFMNHPVGTGPFSMKQFSAQANKLVFYKNPTFREKLFPQEAAEKYKYLLRNAGKQLPLLDSIEAHIMLEGRPRDLKFQAGELDYTEIPNDNLDIIPAKELTPAMKSKGIKLEYTPSINIHYVAFNHLNKLFKDNPKLRQAMSMALDRKEFNELFYSGLSAPAASIVPPGIVGHRADYESPYHYDLEKAKQYLAEAGYPGGKGLPKITLDVGDRTISRQMGEYFQRSMAKIGIKIEVIPNPFPELHKKVRHTKSTMLFSLTWVGDYPDAENFLQILYGPNKAPGSNGSNFDNPKFNELFEKAVVMQDSPQKRALYEQLNQMAAEQVPLIYLIHPVRYVMYHSWLQNYVLAPNFVRATDQYLDIDVEKKKALKANF